jgi:hypothetical protein
MCTVWGRVHTDELQSFVDEEEGPLALPCFS